MHRELPKFDAQKEYVYFDSSTNTFAVVDREVPLSYDQHEIYKRYWHSKGLNELTEKINQHDTQELRGILDLYMTLLPLSKV